MSTFDAKEFYHLGIKIAKAYKNETGYRTAIGRVYYACFLVGYKATKNKGWFHPTKSASDHSGICRILKDKGQNKIANKLLELYRLREHADYHIENCKIGDCSYCDDTSANCDLVDAQHWQSAKIIADNILPKLEAINPK